MYYYQVNASNTVGLEKWFFSTLETARQWGAVLRGQYGCMPRILACALEHHESWQVIRDTLPERLLVRGELVGSVEALAGEVFSPAARENIAETGASPEVDLQALTTGERTPESLLAYCLDGADEDRVQGWRDYVSVVVAAHEATSA